MLKRLMIDCFVGLWYVLHAPAVNRAKWDPPSRSGGFCVFWQQKTDIHRTPATAFLSTTSFPFILRAWRRPTMGSFTARGTRRQFAQFFDALDDVKEAHRTMAITQAQFDTDLAAYNTAVENLITAAQAAVAAAKAAGVDLATEDAAVQKAAADVATELAALNPTPPAPPA